MRKFNNIQDEDKPTLILIDKKNHTIAHLDYYELNPLLLISDVLEKEKDTTTQINFGINSSDTNGKGIYVLKGTENNANPIYYYRGDVNNNNVIFGGFCWQIVRTTDTGGIKMIYNGVATGNGQTCENTTHATRTLSSTSKFNSYQTNMSDIGYMYNKRYSYSYNFSLGGQVYFGSGVSYDNGVYTLTGATVTAVPDDSHHYSCDSNTLTTCSKVKYYYISVAETANKYRYYYIVLQDGETIEDAIYKMTGNATATVKARTINQNYKLNQNDSVIKTTLETWFENNLTNVVDNTKTDYRPYLEDTVFCNDRSFQTDGPRTLLKSGWNPNASGISGNGVLTEYIDFDIWTRYYDNGWYSTSNVPRLTCPNETDRFSVGSTVAHLNYPVGLLTGDEVVLAGAGGNSFSQNKSYYLYTGGGYWLMSASYYYYDGAHGLAVSGGGYPHSYLVNWPSSVRPVVSLKPETKFERGGKGTPTNPYRVAYN